jgi:glycosyltransferase involved in cell wall biosynthesis
MTTWDPFRKPHVLYILHHLGGGTESHVNDLIDILSDSQVSYVLQVFNKKVMSLKEYNNGQCLCYTFNLDTPIQLVTFHENGYKNTLRKIVNTFGIDVIHVHHLIGHTLDVFDIAKEQSIPIIFSVHDYYAVCPQIQMLDENSTYCKENLNLEKCQECLNKTLHFSHKLLYEWRYEFRKALRKCDVIITPTRCVKDTLIRYYDLRDETVTVIGHGHKNDFVLQSDGSSFSGDRPLNIAYIGVLTLHKGSNVFYELAHLPELKDKVRWSVIGSYDLVSEKGYDASYNVAFFGRYKDFDHLRQIIYENKIDIVILPSIWPETFSYTLSEAWAIGVPVIVSRLGALKERVEENKAGWIVDINNVESVKRTIIGIWQSPDDYREKKNTIQSIKLKPMEKIREEYIVLYERMMKKSVQASMKQFNMSNSEVYNTINATNIAWVTSEQVITDPNRGLSFDKRLAKCYNENGLTYTMRRIPVYIKQKLIR